MLTVTSIASFCLSCIKQVSLPRSSNWLRKDSNIEPNTPKRSIYPRVPAEWAPTIWALFGSLLLAAIFGRVALLNLNYGVIGGDLDGYENMWNNYWVKTALFDLHSSPYFTDYLYYPTGISLRFHTLNPFNGLLTLPFNLTLGYIPSINLLFVLSLALTTFFTFLFIRDIVGRALAAFAGAAVFVYANILVVNFLIYGQSEKLSMEWLPLYFFFMFRALYGRPVWGTSSTGSMGSTSSTGSNMILRRDMRHWPVYAVLSIATLVIMALTDWQYVMFSVFATILYGIFVLLRRVPWREKGVIFAKLTGIGGGFLLIVGPTLLLPMLREAIEFPWLNVSQSSQS